MSLCQVLHVQIVSHSSSVRRIIVVPEDIKAVLLAHNNLLYVGEQVVGLQRQFAQEAIFGSSNWVEISQADIAAPRLSD